MARYFLLRLGMAAGVVVLVAIFLALLVRLVPGDPATAILGPRATPELVAYAREDLDLNSSIPQQVWNFLSGAAKGDLGHDFLSRQPVTDILVEVLPHTIILAAAGLLLAVLIGVPLGVIAARHAGGWVDHALGYVSLSVMAFPPYVIGLFLILLLSVRLGWLPAVGAGSLSDPLDYGTHLIMPTVALAALWIGYIAQLVRSSLLETLNEPYIRSARAFGIGEQAIFFRFALKNALVPTLAVVGVGLGSLLGGVVFLEIVFSRPGLGSVLVDAVSTRNFSVVRGVTFVVALLFVFTNLAVDLLYRFADPRVRPELHRM